MNVRVVNGANVVTPLPKFRGSETYLVNQVARKKIDMTNICTREEGGYRNARTSLDQRRNVALEEPWGQLVTAAALLHFTLRSW